MIKKLPFIFLVLMIFFIISCQEIFTYSALNSLERDPSSLSEDEKIAYAYAALESQKVEYMEKAYAVMIPIAEKYPNDEELQMLTYNLAIGASGMQAEILGSLDAFLDPGSTDADTALDALEDAMANMDTDDLVEALEIFDAIEEGSELDESEYLNAALVIVVLVAQTNESDGSANLDAVVFPETIPTEKPYDIADLDPEDPNDSDALLEYALWAANKGGVDNIDEYFE